MDWQPLAEARLWDLINDAERRMNPAQAHLWEWLRVAPRKWAMHPWGDEGGGFWIVGILGGSVVWYNDIEEGFNISRWSEPGTIDEYWCNQDELEWTVQRLLGCLEHRHPLAGHAGPPMPLP